MNDRIRTRIVPQLLTITIAAICFGAMSADDSAPPIDDTRATIEKYVETRRIIAQEERDWALGKEILEDRNALVEREIADFRAKIDAEEGNITAEDLKLAEQQAEAERIKSLQASLKDNVALLEERTKRLLARLPAGVQEKVRLLSQHLPEKPAETRLELHDRFLNVIGILNELDKFNREITVLSEVRSLPDGNTAEVTTAYLGLGQAYYVGGKNTIAGYGSAGEDAWIWIPDNDAAQAISDVFAILKNESVASFVPLPVAIK